MTPKVPRPPSYAKFDDAFKQAHSSSLPPPMRKAITERDVKIASDATAMANAITTYQVTANKQHEQLVSQVAAMHAHLITFHAWATRNPWLSSPWTKLSTTFLGAAAGAYAATKGLK